MKRSILQMKEDIKLMSQQIKDVEKKLDKTLSFVDSEGDKISVSMSKCNDYFMLTDSVGHSNAFKLKLDNIPKVVKLFTDLELYINQEIY